MGKVILLVEDDDNFRNSLAKVMKDAGYEVIECDFAGIAFNLFKTHKPDLAILDYRLPVWKRV